MILYIYRIFSEETMFLSTLHLGLCLTSQPKEWKVRLLSQSDADIQTCKCINHIT